LHSRQPAHRRNARIELAAECDGVTIHAARKAMPRYRAGRVPVAKSAGLAPKTVKNVHRMIHRALSDAAAWRYLNTTRPNTLVCRGKAGKETHGWSSTAKPKNQTAKPQVGARTISLDPLTVAYLRRHLAMLSDGREAFGDATGIPGNSSATPNGRAVHPDTITTRYNRIVDPAGVKRIRLHDVRHTYATVSLDSGVDPKVVADPIGHAHPAVTLAIYTHRSTAATAAQPKPSRGCSWGPGGSAGGAGAPISDPHRTAGYATHAKVADLCGGQGLR
jgi:Phage integrase family